MLRRRELLQGAAFAVGAGLVPARSKARTEVRRVPLGRTGLLVSDVSFGSSRLSGAPDLVRYALDQGINYFDTAETYRGGRSETAIGEALRGHRASVVLASKVKCETGDRAEALMQRLDGSLRRLQTDYIDVYFNHAVNDPARLENSEWYEFTERARELGKIRFTGMSGHAGRLIECLDLALDHDRVDVILVAYNFGQDPSFYQRMLDRFDFITLQADLPRVLKKAHSKGVGVVAMKTLMGARLNDMRPYEGEGATFAQSAFRWVLSDPHVDALIVSMTSRERVDEYLVASGAGPPGAASLRLLERYARLHTRTHCRQGCGVCLPSCPEGVPISDVLRTRMYAADYNDPELARQDYSTLGRAAEACATCTHTACLGSCPYGLPIPSLTRSTHSALG